MKNDEKAGGNDGNNSANSSETRIMIITVGPTGKTLISNYVIDQMLVKPLKVFGNEPVSHTTHDKLPNRYVDVFEKGFSKVKLKPDETREESASDRSGDK
jgi:hypothetical protein